MELRDADKQEIKKENLLFQQKQTFENGKYFKIKLSHIKVEMGSLDKKGNFLGKNILVNLTAL